MPLNSTTASREPEDHISESKARVSSLSSSSSSSLHPMEQADEDLLAHYQRRRQPLRRLIDFLRGHNKQDSSDLYCLFCRGPDEMGVSRRPHWSRRQSRTSAWTHFIIRVVFSVVAIILVVFGLLHSLEVLLGHDRPLLDINNDNNYLPNWGLPGQISDGLAAYPTDATRDVIPVPCHSHNDYWRRVPFYEAIHWGCVGVEADVWSFDTDDTLYVGHNRGSLTPNRTFNSLYIDPIVEVLDKMNASPLFVDPENNQLSSSATPHGLFDVDPAQTLVLLVDFKTAGLSTFNAVSAYLEPLRRKNYLSHWDGAMFHSGPVTVVGTGKTPFDAIVANTTYRDIFYDAPIAEMYEPETQKGMSDKKESDGPEYNSSNSYYASASLHRAVGSMWSGSFTTSQLETIRGQVRGAKRRGLLPRYWETPAWPVSRRNEVWRVLVEEGVGMLNVDDLAGAATGDWRKRGSHGWFD